MSELNLLTAQRLLPSQRLRHILRGCDWGCNHLGRVTRGTNWNLDSLGTWLQQRLPALNDLVFNNKLSAESLAAILSSELLTQLPPAAALDTRQAWQVLMILGCCGSSVERHAQQACVRRGEPAVPGTALGWLTVRCGRQRFGEYFRQVADLVGQPYRDPFVTFVEHNGPCVRVFHPETGQVIHSLPAAFDDEAYLTFSANPETDARASLRLAN